MVELVDFPFDAVENKGGMPELAESGEEANELRLNHMFGEEAVLDDERKDLVEFSGVRAEFEEERSGVREEVRRDVGFEGELERRSWRGRRGRRERNEGGFEGRSHFFSATVWFVLLSSKKRFVGDRGIRCSLAGVQKRTGKKSDPIR